MAWPPAISAPRLPRGVDGRDRGSRRRREQRRKTQIAPPIWAKTSGFLGPSRARSIDFGRFPPMFRVDAAQIEERFLSLALCSRKSAPPASLRARRFGVERDSLFTLDSERRFRLEA